MPAPERAITSITAPTARPVNSENTPQHSAPAMTIGTLG